MTNRNGEEGTTDNHAKLNSPVQSQVFHSMKDVLVASVSSIRTQMRGRIPTLCRTGDRLANQETRRRQKPQDLSLRSVDARSSQGLGANMESPYSEHRRMARRSMESQVTYCKVEKAREAGPDGLAAA